MDEILEIDDGGDSVNDGTTAYDENAVEDLVKRRVDEIIAERLRIAPVKRVGGKEVEPFLKGLFGG